MHILWINSLDISDSYLVILTVTRILYNPPSFVSFSSEISSEIVTSISLPSGHLAFRLKLYNTPQAVNGPL